MKDLRWLHWNEEQLQNNKFQAEKRELALKFHQQGKKFSQKHSWKEYQQAQLATEQKSKKKSLNYWTELKPLFLKIVGNRCPICADTIGMYDSDIDHYRPKSLYLWLVYEYTNYLILCKDCNSKYKRDLFPLEESSSRIDYVHRQNLFHEKRLLLYPLHDRPADYFEIEFRPHREQFRLRPCSKNKNTLAFQQAEQTLFFFNLYQKRQEKDEKRTMLMHGLYSPIYKLAKMREAYLFDKDNPEKKKKYLKQIRVVKNKLSIGWGELIIAGNYFFA